MSEIEAKSRVQSTGEEIANAVSHGMGFLAAAAATPYLVMSAMRNGSTSYVVGVSIFAATMMLMYMTSTLYHSLPGSRAKKIFRILDHNAIFRLIAGTYTPIALGVLSGFWGWTLFGLVWGLATAGIILKSFSGHKYHYVSMIIYVAMGWLVVIAAKPLFEAMPFAGIMWLLAGGICYTGGIVFYAQDRKPYMHALWHLCVLAGSVCHYVSVMGWVLPTDLWT